MRYMIQITPEGGPEGTRIIEADYFDTNSGGITFYRDGDAKLAIPNYVAAWSEDADVQNGE